jgi:hypothetical protein
MYKKVFLILCSIILLGVLASCGQDDYDDGYDNAPPPPNYISGRITLLNDTSLPISELYLKSSSAPTWGDNQLSEDLEFSELCTRVVMTPDSIDVKVATTDTLSIYYAYRYDIPIYASQKVELRAQDLDFSGSLEIVNARYDGAYIEEIHWSLRGLDTWSPNQITSGSIPPGDSRQLLDLKPGSYDIWIVWSKAPVNVSYNNNIVESLILHTLNTN